MPNCTKFKVTLFADDTFLKMESPNLQELRVQANKEMKNINIAQYRDKSWIQLYLEQSMFTTAAHKIVTKNNLYWAIGT